MDRVVGELQRRALGLRTAPLLRVVEPLPRLAREVARRSASRSRWSCAAPSSSSTARSSIGSPIPWSTWFATPSTTGSRSPEARREAGKPPSRAPRDRRAPREGHGPDRRAGRRPRASISSRCASRAVAAGLLASGPGRRTCPPDEIAALVFRPGLTTADQVSEISGRGVGMDAVKATVESLGGEVEIDTRARPRHHHDPRGPDHGRRAARAAAGARAGDRGDPDRQGRARDRDRAHGRGARRRRALCRGRRRAGAGARSRREPGLVLPHRGRRGSAGPDRGARRARGRPDRAPRRPAGDLRQARAAAAEELPRARRPHGAGRRHAPCSCST